MKGGCEHQRCRRCLARSVFTSVSLISCCIARSTPDCNTLPPANGLSTSPPFPMSSTAGWNGKRTNSLDASSSRPIRCAKPFNAPSKPLKPLVTPTGWPPTKPRSTTSPRVSRQSSAFHRKSLQNDSALRNTGHQNSHARIHQRTTRPSFSRPQRQTGSPFFLERGAQPHQAPRERG